jgi:hypothetical protein
MAKHSSKPRDVNSMAAAIVAQSTSDEHVLLFSEHTALLVRHFERVRRLARLPKVSTP